jgi:hypothetical protein
MSSGEHWQTKFGSRTIAALRPNMPQSKMNPISSEDALLMFKKWHDEKLPVAAIGALLFGSS